MCDMWCSTVQHNVNVISITCCLSYTITCLSGCAVTRLCLIYEERSRLILTSKVPPSRPAVCSVDEGWVVCCASRREDEGEQPGVPAWLRGRLDWIRRLTAGPHLWRRRAERPPVCLPLHQVSIWAWRKDGVRQRVSKWAKWGHW